MPDTKYFEAIYTEIDLFWYNTLLKNEETCTNYENYDYNYEQCVTDNLKDFLNQELGCLPPWFKNSQVIFELVGINLLRNAKN